MRDPAYAAFSALDRFFDIVRQGLAGLVEGDRYFDTIAPDAVFEFRYRFPGWPTMLPNDPKVSPAGVRKALQLFAVALTAAMLAACAQSSVVTDKPVFR